MDLETLLCKLDLSRYQARALLSLLELGRPATVKEISRLSGVPLTKLYSVLEDLQEKDLIRLSGVKPLKYAAISLGEAIARLIDIKIRKLLFVYEVLAEELLKNEPLSLLILDNLDGGFTLTNHESCVKAMLLVARTQEHLTVLMPRDLSVTLAGELGKILARRDVSGVLDPQSPMRKYLEDTNAVRLTKNPEILGVGSQKVAFLGISRKNNVRGVLLMGLLTKVFDQIYSSFFRRSVSLQPFSRSKEGV